MANCKNKIKKKQIDWVPYTTEPDEFCTLSPAATPALDDYLLLEDTSDSLNKKCITIQQIKDLIETAASLPYYECFKELNTSVAVCTSPFTVFSATTQVIPAGEYRIAWAYMWNTARALSHFNAKVLVDGVEIYTHTQLDIDADQGNEFDITCSDNLNPTSFFDCLTFGAEASHTIEIQIFTDDLTYQISVWNKIIEIQRVG